ncbi:MAG: hypothetical protein IPH13_05565 [Planctomycetes bacterium]|nr:hypothetical protein [Planctomycetota bacterium]MCC7172445.1 hypothetical protein [Planctomycetota bacterium]
MNRFASRLIRTLAVGFLAASAASADVTTSISKGKLKIAGGVDADVIAIIGTDFGSVAVTVDGSNAGEFAGVRDIDVKTGAGDDRLDLVAVQIGGSLRVKMGDGDDDLFVSTIAAPVVRPMIVGGDADISLGSDVGDAVVAETNSNAFVNFMGNLTIRGAESSVLDGGGTVPSLEARDFFVGGKLLIVCDGGDVNDPQPEFSMLDDIVVGRESKLEFGDAKDELRITDSQFARKVTIRLGGGDDILDFHSDATKFDGPVDFVGGSGFDSMLQSAGCEFGAAFATQQIEFVP